MQPKSRSVLLVVLVTLLLLPGLQRSGSSLPGRVPTVPWRAQVWFERGQAAASQGDLHTAGRAWQASLRYGAPGLLVYPRLAQVHRQLGDLENLAGDLFALASLQPDDPAWHYQLGLVLIVIRSDQARSQLKLAAELDPDLDQEVRLLERGLSATLLSTDPAFQKVASGRALASIGEWELAGVAFEQATLLNPDYAEAWAFLGEARRQTGTDGLQELQQAVHLDNRSVAANTLLGLYWQHNGRLDLALVYLDEAVQLDPGNPVLQAALGRVLAQQGNLQAGLRHYRRAAQANPRNPAGWRALAGFTIEFGTEVKEVGLPAARTAVLLEPKDPASLDTMAQVYLLLGKPALARRFLDRALAADPGYAPARLHLGLVNLFEGNASEVRKQLQLADSLAPAGTAVEEHARRLLLNTGP